jgi:hypothetical protein
MLGSDPVAMKRIVLPSSLSDAHVDRTCVFLIDEPWAVAAWSLDGVEFWRQEMPFSTVATRPRLGLDARGEVWVSSGQLLFTPASGETIDAGASILQFTSSALAAVGLNSTLTGDEGDAGPGFLMVSIAFFSTLAVAVLAILAVNDGIAALRPDGNTRRSRAAHVGIARGVVELAAVIAVVVAVGIWLAEPA